MAQAGCNSVVLTVVVFAALIIGLLSVAQTSEIHHQPTAWTLLSKIAFKNATVRPPLLIVLVVGGWGWVVSVCHGARLELEQVLGGAAQPPESTYHAAAILLCVLLAAHLVHFLASESPGVTWRPWLVVNCTLNAAFLLLGALPCHSFFAESRLSLRRALWDSVVAPFAPVTFWHVIVADYLTSLAKAFSDLQVSACIAWAVVHEGTRSDGTYVPTTTLWERHWGGCADTYANALMLALPFWWRLMQCLKVYSVTREQKNLWNALK